MTGNTESFFRWIEPFCYRGVDGDVESPTGWFGHLYVDNELVAEYNSDCNEDVSVEAGDYVVRIDSLGFINYRRFDTQDDAYDCFIKLFDEYSRWLYFRF